MNRNHFSAGISIGEFIEALTDLHPYHSRASNTYFLLQKVLKNIIGSTGLTLQDNVPVDFGQFGELFFPFIKMGSISSLNLFELDEFIIFAFYWNNRNLYTKSADIGANLGLHSILMSRCGWAVSAYEPDPVHISILNSNLKLNNVHDKVRVLESAVSDIDGTAEFTRVLGNTTGSHLTGAKKEPYGQLETFTVNVQSIDKIFSSVDFIKMDVEGQESKIIAATHSDHWERVDMILEVGTPENARDIYHHLQKIGVNSFSQKIGWKSTKNLDDFPVSYKEGSLFISKKDSMPWARTQQDTSQCNSIFHLNRI
jgi:FkbM family methyltransferase